MIVDLFMVYQFLKRLSTPFDKWRAFELGIIDKDGNILKSPKTFTLEKERDAFGKFDLMILNLKKLIAKVPGGSTKIATMAAVLYLMKEENENVSEELFEAYIIEVEGATTPSTNTANIPNDATKKSPVLKRKVKSIPD